MANFSPGSIGTRRCHRLQQGFVLIVALTFLLLMTMLAFAAAQRALLQERMAGSFRNAQQARMSAENALRGAEYKVWMSAANAGASLHCGIGALSADDGCIRYDARAEAYAAQGDVTRFQNQQGWVPGVGVVYKGANGRGYAGARDGDTAALAKDPVYIIEDLGSERPPGTGALHESGNTGPNNGGANRTDVHIYRVTARGTGGNPNVVSVVQSTIDAPRND